ncbi:TolC family protein [Nevskia soli]|uniref:TolC family protein n=1 Tax=Nevskia soli TaxID=418856 RepID=UPI0004A6DF9E|nr:TolC family protein [Nevskia soli]
MFQHHATRRALFAAAIGLSFIARAEEPASGAVPLAHEHPFDGSAIGAGEPLSIADAARLALTDQPILSGREASIDAEEQLAVSAAQLPDPRLTAGIKDLPVDRGEAFSVRDDNFTMFSVGISQDFPRGDKRRLKGERKRLEAAMDRLGLDNDRRSIGRDAALAWLDVYESEQALALARQLSAESALQVQALENDYRNGRAAQADWLAARVEASLVNDKAHDWQHHVERMRAGLSRWIGEAAQRPLLADLSSLPPPADFPRLAAEVEHHPVVAGLQKQIETSDTDVKLARQAYKSDFSVEGYFGYRPDYADFAGVQVSLDLPFFTARRQDRDLAAALRQSDAAQDRKADALRELHAEATEDYIDWHHARERSASFDRDIIPDAQRRVDAAQAAYAAGGGAFDAVLTARRSLLDTQLQRLSLAVDAARAQVRLQYFAPGN